ncbi:CsbD family protein [Sphingomonas sp. Leaf21]|uniref:CsbD family protein n=1 Tax=Sphingomonas sp. Leaf21 TaxID=2876550 RepID=UPI001E50164A|nr:CsbD family protein [Sphingomonas sp. Leaf21]
MNKHELRGDARYLGGKVEKAVGDVVDSRDWKVAGVKDQVVGGAEHLYGRAQSVAGNIADATPSLIEEARERTGDALERSRDLATREGRRAADAVRGNSAAAWAVGAAVLGYAIGALIHGRRD